MVLLGACAAEPAGPRGSDVPTTGAAPAVAPSDTERPSRSAAVEAPGAESAGSSEGDSNSEMNSGIVQLGPAVRINRQRREVELDGYISLDHGPLEQVACAKGTREHESIFVPLARPSQIHAALLLAGFTPGQPGEWRVDAQGAVSLTPPSGDEIEVLLKVEVEEFRPIHLFIRDGRTAVLFPDRPFVFAGSRFIPNPSPTGSGEVYLADATGSIIGIVTFGDELIAWREVIPDLADVAEPVWQANPLRLPPRGTPARLLLRPPASLSR